MLVEELMILANEQVGAFLASRRREALYRVHERPDPQSVELLLAKLADLGVPTPPVPETLSPQQAATLAGAISKRVAEYVAQSGRGREAFPALVLRALKQARYDPQQPRPLGAREPRRTATSPRRSAATPISSCTARCCASSASPTTRCPTTSSTLAQHLSEREREAAKIEYLADDICLAWLLERRLFERGWEERVGGRDHRA